MLHYTRCLIFCGLSLAAAAASADPESTRDHYARDPQQKVDEAYSKKIAEYTTATMFNSALTDYLPASATVPTPAKVLGDVAGAPNMLPYTKDIYRYFRLLADSSPRVKVFSIGKSEEGREMIVVAIADEALLADLNDNDARLAQLADPRTIGMDDAKASALVAKTTPVYYITGTIHSTETGAPTALMELAYRLAVDDAPYIKGIRSRVITLITPVVEPDGRDRMVDLYNWHRAHLGENYPPLLYWGHYVAHDNNRDAMGMTLNLTRNVMNTYVSWHAQVLHDLHESVPFLYDNTVGDGPYNAWVDPILTNEWQQLGWDNVQQMTQFGMPGVFTHGDFDTWSPGYLMFIAAMHNGISRLYETFGNHGADTEERILAPDEYSRTWYRQNPPLAKVTWSQRNNNNYEQTALLSTLNYFADNGKQFLQNFYRKSKRSIEKPTSGGPSAYVLSAEDAHLGAQAELLRILQLQHVEIQRARSAFTAQVIAPPEKKDDNKTNDKTAEVKDKSTDAAKDSKPKLVSRNFAAGSYIVRMDQPYSRIADALLDRQYWAPEDAQKHPYDDTGWSMGDQFGTEVVRVTDSGVLNIAAQAVTGTISAPGGVHGDGAIYVIDNHADIALITLRYVFKGADIAVAEKAFDANGRHFNAGALIVRGMSGKSFADTLVELGLDAYAISAAPDVTTHRLSAPRIALMHTWLDTQTEGWWRMALDKLKVPYTYINTQTVAREDDLRRKYDVILFGPVGVDNSQLIVDGLPMWGNAMPWKTTPLTPNMGNIDSTDDIRPGLGGTGVAHLRKFVEQGGLFITSSDSAKFAIDEGLAPGVFIASAKDLRVVGSVLGAEIVDPASPVAFGYSKNFALYSPNGMAFTVSNLVSGDDGIANTRDYKRPTGRGGPNEVDTVQSRGDSEIPALPSAKPWQALPLNAQQQRNNPFAIPADLRPKTIVRFADADDLLISGLLQGGGALAQRAAVVDAHLGHGHTLLFANNPIWRGETIGSYALVFNAMLNFDHLDAAQSAK